ncbi:MAG: ABC transporter permease [Chloroflexota bacterium]|nr:ABC transporter permease [Chloroflexota bacterium]
MTPISILRFALSSLGSNKLRAGLTLLGVVIGVMAVITLMAIGRGAQKSVTSRIEALGTNLLFVTPGSTTQGGVQSGLGSASTLTVEDAYVMVGSPLTPGVLAVAPELQSSGQLKAGNVNMSARVIGVTPEYRNVRNLTLASGEFINPGQVEQASHVVVLGSRVVTTLFGGRDPVGQSIRISGREFKVIGVLKSAGTGLGGFQDNQVFVPITTAYYRLSSQRTSTGQISAQSISVQVRSQGEMDDAVQQVSTLLRLRHRLTGDNDFVVSSQEEAIKTLKETTNIFVVFLGAIAGISLLVGGIGIMNIMLVSVTERTREIGIRKAVGAKRRDILAQFLAEATILSLGGGVVGLLVGWLAARFLDGKAFGTTTLTTVVTSDTAILAVAVSAAIGLFFGIYPALRASRLHPIEALRYE